MLSQKNILRPLAVWPIISVYDNRLTECAVLFTGLMPLSTQSVLIWFGWCRFFFFLVSVAVTYVSKHKTYKFISLCSGETDRARERERHVVRKWNMSTICYLLWFLQKWCVIVWLELYTMLVDWIPTDNVLCVCCVYNHTYYYCRLVWKYYMMQSMGHLV